MQPAVFPLTVCDLWGGAEGICRALLSHCTTNVVQLADLCGSFAQLVLSNLFGFSLPLGLLVSR